MEKVPAVCQLNQLTFGEPVYASLAETNCTERFVEVAQCREVFDSGELAFEVRGFSLDRWWDWVVREVMHRD